MSVVRQIHHPISPAIRRCWIILRCRCLLSASQRLFSRHIEIFSYISTSDRDEFHDDQEELLLEIGRIIKGRTGPIPAFPSNM
ncbi:MAG: hypothetical protein HPM95_16715 [Alphaproteobacteria bacterium]|nr:hypothetical protein [Alphaproteobacteria bacterium]